MNKSFKYLPQKDRKKILLICDDIRVHSGVATVAKEIVMETAHHFNWAQIAGAIKHPEQGKIIDSGNIELGVQRDGYHEYFLKGKKFDTKLHLRVVPLKEQKQWIAFSSFVKEPVESSTDDGIWDIREDENKDLSFETLE